MASSAPLVVIAAGSDSDMPHLETLSQEIGKFKIDAEIRICSAHKQPGRLQSVIEEYNKSDRPIMLVGCAGGTDALSGTASYLATFPVVSCPPDGMNNTCLTNPPGSSNAFIVKPANIGKFAAQLFSSRSKEISDALDANIKEKITKLEQADAKLTGKTAEAACTESTYVPLAADAKPLAVIAAGSDSDMPHLETLKSELAKFKIDAEIRICSAHKQPGRLESVIGEYNKAPNPIMMVGCAGGTDALSGTASYSATFPVVSCPPDGMNNTCLTNPPGSSNAFIVKPGNVAKFAAQMFSHHSADIAAALCANIDEKIVKLEQADSKLTGRTSEGPQVNRSAAIGADISEHAKPLVVIAAGSDSDMPHLENIKKELAKFKLDAEIRICSAHKQPARLQSVIAEYNASSRPVMMVGCAGGTDALSGTASYLATFPVVSCPPDGMNNSCLTNPPGSSNAFIVKPANVAKFAAQMFAQKSKDVSACLNTNIAEKITKLEEADGAILKKQRIA
jgi:phosphoribosylaminoimidazole carboxylase PurE protein